MKFAPGQVVNLKSGGQPLTVVAVNGESVECMWLGEEGDLFREAIPSIALELAFGDLANLDAADEREFANANAVASDDDDEEDEDEEDGEEDEDDEDEEDDDEDEDDEDEDEDEEDGDEDKEEEDRALEEVRGQLTPAAPRRRRVPA